MIEDEESPFTISQKGKQLIDSLLTVAGNDWAKYRPLVLKNLAVRVLQKCKNYFKNMKLAALYKLLGGLYETPLEVEALLYECNHQQLVQTVIDHATASITFNQEVEVAAHLVKFGLRLKDAFQRVQAVVSEGKERERIFMKVKEKMEQEMSDVLRRKLDMDRQKRDIERAKAEENKTL